MTKDLISNQLYRKIKDILTNARQHAYREVNFIMVEAYWNVGRLIAKEEQKGRKRAGYGEQLLETLSMRLYQDFGKGFDPSNLWNMRRFYQTFPILDALRRELSWTHYRLLMRVENENARNFYIEECAKSNWSTRQFV